MFRYASEVVPTVLRPYVTAWVCMCWGMGILISSAVVRAVVNVQGDLGEYLEKHTTWRSHAILTAISVAIAFCSSVGLAGTPLCCCLLCTRLALVPRPKGQNRRGQSQSHSTPSK